MPQQRHVQPAPAQPHVQIHLTGRDIIAMQRQEVEAAAARAAYLDTLRAAGKTKRVDALRGMNDIARWFHTTSGAITLIAATAISLILTFAFNFPIVYVLAAGAAVMDWQNFSTWHGRINWPLLKETQSTGYWLAVVGLVLFAFVPLGVYAVDCLLTRDEVRQIAHEQVGQEIAHLEDELQITSPTEPEEA